MPEPQDHQSQSCGKGRQEAEKDALEGGGKHMVCGFSQPLEGSPNGFEQSQSCDKDKRRAEGITLEDSKIRKKRRSSQPLEGGHGASESGEERAIQAAEEYAQVKAIKSSENHVFRLRGLPLRFGQKDALEMLSKHFGLSDDLHKPKIRSFAETPDGEKNVAIICFQKLPDQLRVGEGRDEWTFQMADPLSISDEADGRKLGITIGDHFRGLTVLSCPTVQEHDVDCVAITGLGGHAFGSFKEKDGSHMWLCDDLPQHLSSTRIMTYGYDSSLQNSLSFQDIKSLGTEFMTTITSIRPRVLSTSVGDLDVSFPSKGTISQESRKPLFFIAHSYHSVTQTFKNLPKKRAVFGSIYGASFFGVPNRGMNISSLKAIVRGQFNESLILSLSDTSSFLREQQEEFRKAFRFSKTKNHRSRIECYYETMASKTAIKNKEGVWVMEGPEVILVSDDSATSVRAGDNQTLHIQSVNRDHSQLVKFTINDNVYDNVRSTLEEFVVEAREMAGVPEDNMSPEDLACLQSLAFPKFDFQNEIAKASPETCVWILQHESYKRWRDSEDELLWIKGHPGSGKSTLMGFIFRNGTPASEEDLRLGFFFHAQGHELQKTSTGMLRSLLYQVYDKVPSARPPIRAAFRKKCKRGEPGTSWEWHCRELKDLFSGAVSNATRSKNVTIFVDALDEAEPATIGEETALYFHTLRDKLEGEGATARICISCRHYPQLGKDDNLEVCIEKENCDGISKYVENQLYPGLLGPEPGKRLIDDFQRLKEDIKKRASGQFLWLDIIIKRTVGLISGGEPMASIHDQIFEVPQELFEFYQHVLEKGIPRFTFKRTLLLMQWVCFTVRPLSVAELRCVMPWADDDNLMRTQITTLSGGLVEIKTQDATTSVQFIHQSVNDFFQSRGLLYITESLGSSPSQVSADDVIGQSHDILCQSCLDYLKSDKVNSRLRDIYNRKPENENALFLSQKLPFALYSTKSWFLHAEKAEAYGVLQKHIIDQFGTYRGAVFHAWITIFRATDSNNPRCPESASRLIHIAASSNLLSVTSALLRYGENIDIKDDAGNTPLHHAARWDHAAIVKDLLDSGADDSMENMAGSTALELSAEAAIKGCTNTLRMLLEWWIDDDGTDGLEDLRALLAHGNRVNAKQRGFGNSLQAASRLGFTETVRLLLGQGANIDSQSKEYGTALQSASLKGHLETVQFLLLKRARVNEEAFPMGNALLAASYNGHTEIVWQLFQHGASVNAQSGGLGSALQMASSQGHTATVKLLINCGADVGAQGGDALDAATIGRHQDTVQLLRNFGARQLKRAAQGEIDEPTRKRTKKTVSFNV